MPVAAIYVLTVYDDDDATVLFDVSTDPAHPRPYLKAPDNFPEQEVNFAKGSASIGQMNVQIVDVPTVATDQDTGYLTGQLPDASGFSALLGHRVLVTEDLDAAGPATIIDGVLKSVKLLDTFAAFELELRDIRERERKATAFANTTAPTVFPRGALDGFGVLLSFSFFNLELTYRYPLPPTVPLRAIYRSASATRGFFVINEVQPRFEERRRWSDEILDVMDHISPLAAQPEVTVFDLVKVLWRDTAGGGAYNEVTQIAHDHPDLPDGGGKTLYVRGDYLIFSLEVNNEVTGDALPANLQAIDVIVQYDGPPTDDWPHYLIDLTVGELLRNLYRGDFSDEDPRIRFNEAALLALTTPIGAIIREPIKNIREWAEKNAYPIEHAAPVLNAAGEIAPITYLLPDASELLVDLDNTNSRPAGGGWQHGTEDAINIVKVTYRRDYRIDFPTIKTRKNLAGVPDTGIPVVDLLREREIIVERRTQESIDLLGEQPLEVDSVLLRATGTIDGAPLVGDVRSELGEQVARRIGEVARDRFALGGQYFALECDRTDADVEGLAPGSYVTVSVSWMPDYGTGERNLNRLAQVISRRNLSAAWVSLALIDAGTAQAPLAGPTLGTVTVNAEGVVSIPVTALGAGAEARVDYALSILEPAAGDKEWTFLDRVSSVPTTLTTPGVPQGQSVWVRARSEATGRRPSVYTTAVNVTATGTPRMIEALVELDEDGIPKVFWVSNGATNGVRIHYERHLTDVTPTYPDSVDFDAADEDATLSEIIDPVLEGFVFSIQIEPFTGWDGTMVTGTAGPRREAHVHGRVFFSTLEPPPLQDLEWYGPFDEGSGFTLRDRSGNLRDAAPEASGALITWVRGVAGMAVDFPGAGVGYQLLTDAQAGAIEGLFYASCWIKVDDTAGDANARVISRGSAEYFNISLQQNVAFPQDITFNYSDTQVVLLSNVITSPNVWYFLLAQWDQTLNIVEFWIGSEATGILERLFRSESLAAFAVTTRVLGIGSTMGTAPAATNPFDGSIDDVRIGAPAALLTHHQVLALFRLPGFGSALRDSQRPEVERQTSQVGLVGTLALVIDDPNNLVTATAFEPIAGAGDFDLSTDPSTWAIFDTTAPFTLSDTVVISEKHTSRIGWAVRYTDQGGTSIFVRGIETFDPDEIAELTGLEIGFEDDGTVIISWTGDEDWTTGFVRVGLGSAPGDPTAATNDGDLVGQNGAIILDGTGSTTLRQATIGQMVFVKVLPETGAGVAGVFQRRRMDTEFVPPRFEAELDRDAQGNATLRLTITDPSGAIVSPGPQFSKRAGSQAGDAWSGFSAVWDTEPSNPPFSGLWVELLVVPGGEEAGIRWQYSWADEDGTTRTHGFTHYTSRIDENQVELVFPCDNGTPQGDVVGWILGTGGVVTQRGLGASLVWNVPLPMPIGVTLEEFDARLFRSVAADFAECRLIRGDINGASTTLATLTGSAGGWSTQSNTAISEVVIADRSYHGAFIVDGSASNVNARAAWCRLVYDRQTLEQVY